MQLAGLLSEGSIRPTFGAVLEVSSAEAAVEAGRRGRRRCGLRLELARRGTSASGYSRGTLADLVARGEVSMDRFAVIWSSPPIGHGPFAVVRALPEEDKGKIESYLMALSAHDPAAYDMLDPFYGGGYAPVDPQDYTGLETLLAQNVDALRLPGGPATTGPLPARR